MGDPVTDGDVPQPLTMGDLGRAIGRYTESEGGDSPETMNARSGLFAIYDRWVDAGRPEVAQAKYPPNESRHRFGTPGRFDADGVEWWACDPYPFWYRWEGRMLYVKGFGPWEDVADEPAHVEYDSSTNGGPT